MNDRRFSEAGLFHAAEGFGGVATGTGPVEDILPPVGNEDVGQAGVDASTPNAAPAAEAIVDDGIDAAKLSTTPPGELMPGLEEPVAPEL
ncbi:MAG TPA: hypothetical protein PKU78_04260 [Candidatus Dojkabacteria bacterium]|nr:hypothetical protein [Candidatus Dojkabacteria bacterium]HRO65407.1 hypothetical protein [Candidatus Dojkabacteria bacterium]HRP50889.1 hypothetical protein [Candidatus Dojkabacteria bacterium]